MFDNLLAKLPSLKNSETEEVDEAQAKRDRIEFHRTKVRNGPVKFREATSGQVRRFNARLTASMQRKGYRRQVRTHLSNQREGMVLRGMLQAAGALPYFAEVGYRPGADGVAALKSITWIVARFADDRHADENGRIEVTEPVVMEALTSALNRWQDINGLGRTELPEGYVLPVQVAS